MKKLETENFEEFSKECGAPDDVTVGFLMSQLSVPLTEIEEFHSHLERLSEISDLENQVKIIIFFRNFEDIMVK